MKGNSLSVKLTSALLAFLFIIAPIFPVLAQEAAGDSTTPAEVTSTPASTEIPANTDSTGTVNADAGKTKDSTLIPSDSGLVTSSDKKDASSPVGDLGQVKNSKDPSSQLGAGKKGTGTTGTQPMSATSTSSSSSTSSNSSSNQKQVILNPNDINGPLTYDYPITVPPGRNGLQPDLKLSYNSQLSGEESAFGYGWSISIPYIERINRKGTDKLYTESYFNSSLSGELVLISGTSYGSKVDNGEFLKYDFSNNSWLVTDKNGIKYKFGYNAVSRQDNSSDSTKVFKWMLEEIRDTNDNYVRYEYFKDAGQIYPSRVVYTGSGTTDGVLEVAFLREANPGAVKNYRTGFAVTSSYRVNEIDTKVNGGWVKKYILGYQTANTSTHSLLNSITESGQDELGNVKTLPATTFSYQTTNRNWTQDTSWDIPLPFIYGTDTAQATRVIDVNGDGLSDVIKSVYLYSTPLPDGTWQDVTDSEVYLNNGHGWILDNSWQIPLAFFDGNGSSSLTQSSQIMDINGDGLPDLIRSRYGNKVRLSDGTYPSLDDDKKVYLNNGHGWTLDNSWQIPLYFYDSRYGSLSQAVKIADINGDGLPDLLRSNGWVTNGQVFHDSQVYLNNGHGWTQDTSWDIPLPFFGGGYPSEAIRVIDINGDGLVDIIRSRYQYSTQLPDGTWQDINDSTVYLNNGHGWTLDNFWIIPLAFEGNGDVGITQSNQIMDINGDGLPDLLRSHTSFDRVKLQDGTYLNIGNTSESKVYLNNGHGWTLDNSWQIPLYFYDNAHSGLEAAIRIADVNGDGLPDLLRSNGWVIDGQIFHDSQVYLNNGPKSDLLTRITYPTGGKTDITYKATPLYLTGSSLSNPNLPFIIDTVQTLTTNDGFGNTSTTTYSYEGGKYYYNNAFDRKLSGFAKITKTDSVGNVTKDYYHQGDATNSSQGEYLDHISKSGKPYRTEIYDNSGNLYSKTINQWENYDLGNNRNFVKLSQKIDFTYDGNATHKDKAEFYYYSNTNGNLTQKIQWGGVNGSDDGTFTDTGSDKFSTLYSYASNPTLNVIGLPSQVTTVDQVGNTVKESKQYYDGLALGSAGKGNLTKEENWKSGTDYTNTQKSYNAYGLVTQETDPRGKITTYAYDSYNLYPATVTNPLNQATQYTYDYSSGKVKQTTDPNGFIFQTVYDGLDRVTGEKQPDLTTPTTLVTKSAYTYTDTANAVSVKKTDYLDGTISVDSYSYFDGLGRLIQTRKEAEAANNFSVKDFVYNNRGLLSKESLPYFSTGTVRTIATADNTLYSTYSYDPLARITSTVNSVGTITNAYDDWKVTTTDAKGTSKDLYKDAYDRLIQVGEHNGASTYTTTYTYDGAGNLTKITDASGNVRIFTYDGLGRRLTAQDLHAPADTTFGTWTYTYDASGNLTSQLDPKSQTVNYTYDNLNRPLTEDYTGATGTEVTYAYDTCANGKGRLCSITNSASVESREYNSLGLTSKETKTISSVNYVTQYSYDRQGNNILLTNSDNSQVKYIYNTAGQLEQVQRKESTDAGFINVVTNFNYSPMEQPTTISYANGATTTNTYDSTKLYRMIAKVTTIAGSSHAQDLAYTYDANGNVTRIVDASSTSTSKTANYTYDSLNRLTSAAITNVASGQSAYTENYAYDAIGNITSKNGQAYTYSQTGYANPHAVTSIGSTTFTYDNNGNELTKGTSLTNTWDYNNRLTQSVSGSTTVTYAYDASGQRIKYSKGTTTSYYPSKYYNTDGTTQKKHIFANGIEIGVVTGTGSSAIVRYIHTDHLTGSNIITNSSNTADETLDYYPFGSIRIDSGSFNEQRKFAGHEYDSDTSLSYMNARYYDSAIGRFVSQDLLAMRNSEKVLQDPQSLNYYAYSRNNPLVNIDPTGNFSINVFGLLSNSTQVRIGNWANSAYQNNSAARVALNHPSAPAIIGAAPLLAYGAVAAAPAVISGASELLSSTTAAPAIRSIGIGGVGGLAGQAISDGLRSISTGSLQVSSSKEYFNSMAEGIAGGYANYKYGIYAAGGAVAISNYILNKGEHNSNYSVGESIIAGATTIIGGKVVDSASGIPGRLPNPGTANYYLGSHAQQLGLGEVTENAFSSVVNLFNSSKKEK